MVTLEVLLKKKMVEKGQKLQTGDAVEIKKALLCDKQFKQQEECQEKKNTGELSVKSR